MHGEKFGTSDYWQLKGSFYGINAMFPLSTLPHRLWGLEGNNSEKCLYCPIAKLLGRENLIYQLSFYNLHLFVSYMCASSSNNFTAL